MSAGRLAVIDGVRTPFSRSGTDLAEMRADDLGRSAVAGLLGRTALDPGLIDEVILGCVGQPVEAINIARVVALRSGIPDRVPAVTVGRNCASGCEAITTAADRIAAGRGSVYVVGGTESMSSYPVMFSQEAAGKMGRLARARTVARKLRAAASLRPSDFRPRSGLLLGLTDPTCGMNMGETAEVLARENDISREEQDAYAAESHRRALAAREKLDEEIVPVYPPPRYRRAVTGDNGPRPDATPEKLGSLKTVFDPRNGTVTPGNASQISDGAVALLVTSERRAEELGLEPLGILVGHAYGGCDPERMGLGPVHAIDRAERELRLGPDDADLIELNEAFAAQVLAVLKALASDRFARDHLGRDRLLGAIDRERLNVNGGAIAIGHPVGASGARIALTLLKEMARRSARRGLASLCVGGGQGAALWFERP